LGGARPTKLSAAAILLAAGALVSSASLQAQMEAPSGVWTLTNLSVRTYWWGIVPSGGDLSVLFNGIRLAPGVETIIEDDLGAGYETDNFYTNSDGTPYSGPTGDGSPVPFDRLQVLEGLGVRQGITWDPGRNRNLVDGFLFYRFHFDRNFPSPAGGQLLFQSAFPDRNQILSNSVIGGFSFSTLSKDDLHKTRDGWYGETSVQWGPSFLFNSMGGADFLRLNATLLGFRTLYKAPASGDANLLSVFLAGFTSVDYTTGASIPFYVLESTGGLHPRTSTDDWVRGFETGSYATTFKAVTNFEVRVLGPSIVWPSLVPAVYAFLDAGYYSGFYHDPAATLPGAVASVGAGALIDFFDLFDLNGYVAAPIYGRRVDGATLATSIGFDLTF